MREDSKRGRSERTPATFPLDHPVRSADEDEFGWTQYASDLAERIAALDLSRGAVVAITGPWGSGKTSLLNLLRPELENRGFSVLEFNPWIFEDAKDLSQAFLLELAGQLNDDTARQIRDLAEWLSVAKHLPYIGQWAQAGEEILKRVQHPPNSLTELKRQLASELRKSSRVYAVLVDDIDRLDPGEIRTCFKIVRTLCDLPNFIHVLAFDREYVEQALSAGSLSGRRYLEKICQILIDVPLVDINRRSLQIATGFHDLASLHGIKIEGEDQERLKMGTEQCICSLTKTPRDVRRYLSGLAYSVDRYVEFVNFVDIVLMEALRIFAPDVWTSIRDNVLLLTGEPLDPGPAETVDSESTRRSRFRDFVPADFEEAKLSAVLAAMRCLFPSLDAQSSAGPSRTVGEWYFRMRRVAHREVLLSYFAAEKTTEFRILEHLERICDVIRARGGLAEVLKTIENDLLYAVVARFPECIYSAPPENMKSYVSDMINALQRVGNEGGDGEIVGARKRAYHKVRELLKVLKKRGCSEGCFGEIASRVRSLSGRLVLIEILSGADSGERALVSEYSLAQLKQDWIKIFACASVDELLRERNLLLVFRAAAEYGGREALDRALFSDTRLISRLLKEACYVRQKAGRRVVRLRWNELQRVVGFDRLEAAVRALECENLHQEGRELVNLAKRYLCVDERRRKRFARRVGMIGRGA